MVRKICPKCGSKDIRLDTSDAWAISIGAHVGWICHDCGLALPEFPEPKDKTKSKMKKKIK
jgi:predicted RNA-binding Zn-ribbon protein involved in translation (DUF1610 family)